MKVFFFASGAGSNVDNILTFLKEQELSVEAKVFYNKKDAGVVQVAEKHQIQHEFITKEILNSERFISALEKENPKLIVLAGFLLLVPKMMTRIFEDKMINVHPSLLPAFGGKGMYGLNVHKAVAEAKAKETGITVHYVNEAFDEGAHIAQFKTEVTEEDDMYSIEAKVRRLELENFPKVVFKLLKE